MDDVDGNAIGGLLQDVFGADMTRATGTCRSCATASLVAEFAVYRRAPGVVVRCPACGSVSMVMVRTRGMICTDLTGLADLR
jgi:Zn finger protein HypA/HybF involved in hydrogenase expression